jgi:hypothetical protein
MLILFARAATYRLHGHARDLREGVNLCARRLPGTVYDLIFNVRVICDSFAMKL